VDLFQFGRCGFAFSDRRGGVSPAPYGELNLADHVGDDPAVVDKNRRLAAEALGSDPDRVVYMNQVHGTDVAVARGPWPDGRVPSVDATVTDRPGVVLAVMVADCTPLLLADPVAGVVAAAHAGRLGLAAGVVPATIAAMRELGAQPARMVAYTGPAVCGACYEVPEAMRADVASKVPAAWATTRQGTPAVDVPAGVWEQLAEAGVTEGRRSPVCAMESAEHFSYRREGVTGRFAGFVWLRADETP
jgi:polyphenol oxidase